MRRIGIALISLIGICALPSCSGSQNSASKSNSPAADENNILHITWGGIALADKGEETRHWSNWTINLIDGSSAYGWTSDASITFPHDLNFELAGNGKLKEIVLDTRFEPVLREDGSSSQLPGGSSVRKFAVFGSTKGPNGPFETLFEGEAKSDVLNKFPLPKEAVARWLKLRIDSNWAGKGATRLAEFEALGELENRGVTETTDASGVYTHEYGPITIRQHGNEVFGCYNNGLGTIRGTIFGRIMRLAWFSADEKSIGSATLVPADGKLYGFWYRYSDKMGSPWNATKTKELKDVDPSKCRAALYPAK